MHRVKVKICGLQEEGHMAAAAEAGADYVGMVFAPSRRQVTPEKAERLRHTLDGLRTRPAVVGVFVNESPELVNSIAERCGLDLVQLSGDESSDYCTMIVRPIIRTIHVFPGTTRRDIKDQMGAFRRDGTLQSVSFLLDTGSRGMGGGTGQTFDWRVAREVAESYPVMVAGGLEPDNVGSLVAEVHPHGVDVSSGVERDGRKDSSLIRAFVDAVRRAEKEIEDADNIPA
ncbi:MAG: phosphoribosylanthranilate isomerase [Dehalococcoidia bacterium]|nr:MAG: phosphoribosylanthranilate isomerase [Dehalococcoidia bacterium]